MPISRSVLASRLGVLALRAVLVGLPLGVVAAPAAAYAQDYSAPLETAISDLPTQAENDTGYDRSLFPHWIDADGDGCSTRNEVLIKEADDPVSVGAGCSLSGGRWYSYYDGVSWTDPSDIDIDHMVPLKEAWGSGARSWSTATRQAYANDLDDYRTLVGVTDSVNQSKGDRDPAEWLPQQQVCRYVREWVAVKHRWGLSVDSTEKSALTSIADGCTNSTITVTLAR
ncbi:HNH endonuclease family protein [Nocardioides acrostichi]|uniref:HNH endonuclease n=1 Tax=Nocardioides acrostichi TaxID=2784339 RepID=A0A930V1Y3_9ACTN|nr:HNH endonuclease family protein [Nocardioides acrostichi]MBF4161719.1 HNH endonuclease [Nocardioides acrostichi]